jgi:predicted nucleic acid-binding protein
VAIIVDTGVFVSAADSSEPRHRACGQVLENHAGELVVPAPVVPETAWMIESRLGPAAEAAFLRLVTTGEVQVIELDLPVYQRCIELIETYSDLGLGFVDASVVAVAERERITTIATLNHRDFMVVRPDHCRAFELLP